MSPGQEGPLGDTEPGVQPAAEGSRAPGSPPHRGAGRGGGRRGGPEPRPVKRRHRRGGGAREGCDRRDKVLGSALPSGKFGSIPPRPWGPPGLPLEGRGALGTAAAVMGAGSPGNLSTLARCKDGVLHLYQGHDDPLQPGHLRKCAPGAGVCGRGSQGASGARCGVGLAGLSCPSGLLPVGDGVESAGRWV